MRPKTVRLILYKLCLSIFAFIVLNDDGWLEKTANFFTATAIGMGIRFLSNSRL